MNQLRKLSLHKNLEDSEDRIKGAQLAKEVLLNRELSQKPLFATFGKIFIN